MNDRFTFNPPPPSASAGQAPAPASASGRQGPSADSGRSSTAAEHRTASNGDGPAGSATPPRDTETRPAGKARKEPRDWAFLFLLAFTAMVFFRPQDEIPTLQFLHLAEMCAIGGLTALVMGRLSRNLPVSRITPELVGIFALGLLIILLAPFSIWMGGAIGVFKDLYMKVMLIFLLMVNVLTSPKRIERLTWLVVVASGYIGFRAVLDYARGVNLVENGRVKGAISGIFGNPNDLAMNMVSVLPLALFIAMRPGRTGRRLFGLLAALFMLGAIVATHSRSGAVGLAAMAIVLVSFAIRTRPGLVFGSALLLVLAMPLAPASYWERIASITDASKDETGSREARKNLLRESTQAFLENPLTGVGAGQFKNWNPQGRVEPWREAHDVFLQVGSELGIGGLTLFVFLIARAGLSVVGTRRLLRRIRHGSKTARGNRKASVAVVTDLEPEDLELLDAHSAAMAASLAGWLICALFASVAYNWTFYYLLALAAGPYRILSDRGSPAARPVPRLAQPRLEAAQA